MVIALILFWSIIETGVAIIAACLPTLRPLFSNWSLESVIRSVRSAISLNSLRSSSQRSTRSQTAQPGNDQTTATALGDPAQTQHQWPRSGGGKASTITDPIELAALAKLEGQSTVGSYVTGEASRADSEEQKSPHGGATSDVDRDVEASAGIVMQRDIHQQVEYV